MTSKSDARKDVKKIRQSFDRRKWLRLNKLLCDNFINNIDISPGINAMTFFPLPYEPDIKEITNYLFRKGCNVFLPKIDGSRLQVLRFTKTTVLKKGPFGILQPHCGNILKNPSLLDLVIVPGLAFDLSGNRVGYGKGYYDKLLEKLNCFKISPCFEFQVYNSIQTELHDISVDILITEKRIIFRS